MNFPVVTALTKLSQTGFGLISIDSQLDIKEKYRKQVDFEPPTFHEHHQSYLRMIYENKDVRSKIQRIIHFGLQSHRVAQKHVDFVNSFKDIDSQLVYLKSDIRKSIVSNPELSTQASQKFQELLKLT